MPCGCISPLPTHIPRKKNYQKLVDVERPVYGIFPPEKHGCSKLSRARIEKVCIKHTHNGLNDLKIIANEDTGKTVIVCLPCDKQPKAQEPILLENVKLHMAPPKKDKESKRPNQDYLYRCESRELRGSTLYSYCLCVRRNGLQDDCPRTPCQGRQACLTHPWPDCWPSGGSYGIDYSRSNGIARVNPTLQYRRGNKKNEPEENS